MSLFAPENREASPRHERIYAIYEVAHTAVDFCAAMLFLVGSILFFDESMTTSATWCFVLGSIAFAAKPSLRLARELHYLALGRYEELAPGSGAGDTE